MALVRSYLDAYSGQRAYDALLEQVEKTLIVEALRRSRGNQTQAAKLLGLPRPTLHAKLQKHRLLGPAEPPPS